MDKTFFEMPDFLTITHKPSPRKAGEKRASVNNGQLDLFKYVIPHLYKKDVPQFSHYFKYFPEDQHKLNLLAPVLFEKHVWVEKQLFNAPGAEKLFLYSVMDAVDQIKQINNFYSIYPELLISEPSLVVEGSPLVSWKYRRLVDIGHSYHFANTHCNATTFKLARRLSSFKTTVGRQVVRIDEDVIEMIYSTDEAVIRKAYFARNQGLVSLETLDYALIKQPGF